MQTLWRQKRQECFNIHQKELKPFHFDTDRDVYGNVNLSIFLTEKCNARCDFCVAELRYDDSGKAYIKPSIKDDEEYFDRLEEVLIRLKPLNHSVSITGGEPTLSPRLYRVCQLLKKHNIRKRTITTNGSCLLNVNCSNGWQTNLETLIECGFKHLNISKAHYDDSINHKLMRYPGNEIRSSGEYIKFITNIANPAGLRVRLSCVLLNEGIGTVPEMKKYMNWAEGLGVDNVVFRELMRYDNEHIIKGRIFNFCERNRVTLQSIWEQIDADPEFVLENQVLGYYYYVEVYRYHGIDMVSESADLKQINIEKSKPSDKPIVYEMVFHPNGCLNGSWKEDEDILLNYANRR